MLPGKNYTPYDILRIVEARWWMILLPWAIGTVLGVLAFRSVPVEYQSDTLIMVVPQRIPDSYVRSTVTAGVEDRLPSINEQILSRSRLERIIRDFDLYPHLRARDAVSLEDVIRRMRNDVAVKLEGRESFRITYLSSDPATAQRITERLASFYIEENLRDRETLAEDTSVFIESQLKDAKRRLVEQEQRLEAYRRRYAGELPSQVESNLQAIQTSRLQLQTLTESINRARERRLLVERQLADVQMLPAGLGTPDAGQGAGRTERAPVSAAQQLEAAMAQLDEYRNRRYTAEHPDVRALERAVKDLEAKVHAEARQAPAERSLTPAELARQKRVRDLEADVEMIDRQIAAAQAEADRLRGEIASYQAKVDVLPRRESELVELTRDYSSLQETYASLLSKREDSKLAANLERRQIGEQFKVLDPASLPERPSNQRQRFGLMAGGSFAGLALGLLLVAFLEYRDLSLKTDEDVARVLNLPVLALVPDLGSALTTHVLEAPQRMPAGSRADV